MIPLGFRRLVVLAVVMLGQVAAASKYTGPTAADVHCRIVALLDGVAAVPKIEGQSNEAQFELTPKPAERVVAVEPRGVLSYDDNGWPRPQFMPQKLYLAVPAEVAAVGGTILVHLDYSMAYHREMSPLHPVIRARFSKVSSYSPDAQPWVRKIREERARRVDTFSDVYGTSYEAARARCSTREHRVQKVTVAIGAFATSELQLHEIEFHGAQFSPAQLRQLATLF